MERVDISQLPAGMLDFAERAMKNGIVFTREGKPILVLHAAEEQDWETLSLNANPRFRKMIAGARADESPGMSIEDMRARLGLAD